MLINQDQDPDNQDPDKGCLSTASDRDKSCVFPYRVIKIPDRQC